MALEGHESVVPKFFEKVLFTGSQKTKVHVDGRAKVHVDEPEGIDLLPRSSFARYVILSCASDGDY